MRILLTAHRFWPHVGGTETAVESLARRFAAKGHEVSVATSAEQGSPLEEERDGYSIERFEMRRVAGFRVPPPEYRELVLSRSHDVVHMHGQRIWSSDFLFPYLRKAQAPIVFTAHGFAQWHRRRVPVVDATYYHQVLPRALRHTSAIVALTKQEKDDLVRFGADEDKIVRIADGYEPAEFRALPSGLRERHGFAKDERLLLYAGGFYANKRVDRLVEAAAGLDATLVVLGTDADGTRAKTERLAREKGARLKALGRVPREDVLAAYRECDVFVLGSDFEGFGLVLLEAMAAGLPFVSTPCGAAAELAALGGGLVAPDAAGMRAAIAELLADEEKRRAIGAKGKAAAPAYDWDAIADRYLELFAQVTHP